MINAYLLQKGNTMKNRFQIKVSFEIRVKIFLISTELSFRKMISLKISFETKSVNSRTIAIVKIVNNYPFLYKKLINKKKKPKREKWRPV